MFYFLKYVAKDHSFDVKQSVNQLSMNFGFATEVAN